MFPLGVGRSLSLVRLARRRHVVEARSALLPSLCRFPHRPAGLRELADLELPSDLRRQE